MMTASNRETKEEVMRSKLDKFSFSLSSWDSIPLQPTPFFRHIRRMGAASPA